MKKSITTALYIFHSLVRDKRFDVVCNARHSDYSIVSLEFCGKHYATFELQHDGSNAVECAVYAMTQAPIKQDKAFSLKENTLGRQAVYSVATIDALDFEMYGVRHARTASAVADALHDAVNSGVLEIDDGLSYCDAQMSAGKYSRRVWLRPATDDE